MEKYRLVQEQKGDQEDIGLISTSSYDSPFPEVRITQHGKPRSYISYAMTLFAEGSNTIVLKAMGRALNKAVTIAEILKRKMPLHQWNVLSSVEMIDIYEPIEEGLDIVTSRRYVSCMTITLSTSLIQDTYSSATVTTTPTKSIPTSKIQESSLSPLDLSNMPLDVNHLGYQPPLPLGELHSRDHQIHSQQ